MSLFHKGPKDKLPQYVLVDRLPSSVGPRLLGRIVLDIQSPADYYRPEDPSRDLVNETLEIVDSNFSTLFSINRNLAVEAKIGQIVGVAVDDGRSAEKKFEGRIVRTRFLTQHKDALKKLLEVRRAEIVELLSDAKKGRGYMIVGIKTAADASVSAKQASHRTTKIGVEFPVNQASAAASHGALQTAAANPQAKMDFTNDASVATSTHMDGEQIFAVRYRIVTLKRKHGQDSVDYGDVKRVNVEDGVYGQEGKEPIFDEGDTIDDEEGSAPWDDDDFDLSNESMKSVIKKTGLNAVIAKANE